VRELIGAAIGEEYLEVIEIDMDTSFADDLEMESIEFVAMAEDLRARYGEKVDFAAWLAEMDIDEIIALSVGDVVRFVSRALADG
jgi:acyl carrier protein